MLFSSVPFLYYFLPCVMILYFGVPKVMKNVVLLLASIFFYAWGEPGYVVLMLVTILVGYVSVLAFDLCRNEKQRKVLLFLSVAVCLGFLGYFKYADFFIRNFNRVTGLSVPLLQLALPVGISFYTFQVISYIVDVYRGDARPQKNVISLATYITMFPQLIAGPIVRYSDIAIQLKGRKFDIDGIAWGIRRFILGLAKKVLIANSLGELCEIFRASEEKVVLFFWIYAIATSLQVYFDFSGYSDMAIGLGRIFGFHFPENFNYPFISGSITEFWRRWHMSLGTWFRDYVYIPLGGNRAGERTWYRNIFLVWLLTGFWHGAEWNFIVWGLFFGILLVAEKKWFLKFLKKSRGFSHLYLITLVIISFVIFQAVSLSEAWEYLKCMFGAGNLPFISSECIYYCKSYGMILLIAGIGATPLMKNLMVKFSACECGKKMMGIGEIMYLFILLLVVTAYLVDGSFNPFLYFRF